MKEKIKMFINTKQFHICMIVLIIFIILFVVGIISLKYSVEGEINLPFYLSKISIISSSEGVNNEDGINKWNLIVNQNNDIYLYIEKNKDYKDIESIKSITLNEFNIENKSKIGELKLFRPDNITDGIIFKNNTENEVDKIEYIGDMSSNVKELKISNQGGLVVFRYAINNVGNYISNDDIEINHSELLKKLYVNKEDIKFKITFSISINLNSGKTYKSNIVLELPVNDIIEKGTQSVEYTNMNDIVFKRN